MGVDMLDILLRLEKTFRVKIAWEDLERRASSRKPLDLLVVDLIDQVRDKRCPFTIEDGVIATDVTCVECGHNLRAVSPFKYCPDCGTAAGYEAQIRAGVHRALIDALGIKLSQITDEASLVRDLGAQ